jgi:S-formylglutathione hydrolase FrmB
MAHLRCDFFAESLTLSTSMTVILPERAAGQIGMGGATGDSPPPVLYLLHGLSDDDTIWSRRTSIERYVAPLGLAVVMPQVHRSFYTDEVYGEKFWTFVSEELPAAVRSFFRVSAAPEDTYVAGLSMGGYGAMKLALRHPDRFAAAATLSGALDFATATEGRDDHIARDSMITRIVGHGRMAGTDDDLFHLVDTVDPATLPPLFLTCGQDDPLVGANRRFVEACASRGVDLLSSFAPGTHEWGYWDTHIQQVLGWMWELRSGS